MRSIKIHTFFALVVVAIFSQNFYPAPPQYSGSPTVRKTIWHISPSFKFDVICFLNSLTGDEFYLDYYKADYEVFRPKFTTDVQNALVDLKRKIKDENKGIISALLAINFSATDDETLADMIRTLDHSEKMQANLRRTAYYSDEDWKIYESVKPDLKTIFQFLIKIKFYDYWKTNIRPKIEKRIREINSELHKYPVVEEVEKYLGFQIPSNKITIYLLYYNKPHGIKITGTRFLTGEAWPLAIVVRNAVHEMMHPPWADLDHDRELKDALGLLKKDDFIVDKVLHHDPSFGYNSVDGLIEEDTIQAIEQTINERLKISVDARKRWKESDDKIHVFAVAFYQMMREEKFPQGGETLRSFLLRMIKSGKLGPGKIKPIYDAFYAPKPN